MKIQSFRARSLVEASPGELYEWHARSGALERLIPPWERVDLLERTGDVQEGSRVTLRVRLGPLSRRWVAVHRKVDRGRQFQDVQEEGPFASWSHTHRFEPDERGNTRLEDHVEYALPFGPIGRILGSSYTRSKLRRLFTYRHAVVAADLARQLRFAGGGYLDVAVTGASGLIGRSLVAFLQAAGHKVRRLVRRSPVPGAPEVQWDPSRGRIDTGGLEGVDAVVHLAGEGIAEGRWTERRKARIRDSRFQGTRLVTETLAGLSCPPKVLINASAIGFYGNRGEEELNEASSPGSDFLAETCKAWEAAAEPAERRGIRVVRLRIGVVLSPAGGALSKMLPVFRLGLGGKLGSGRQYMSWVSHFDLIGIIHFALFTEALQGPVNAVAPSPVTNAEFTQTLGRVLRRPATFPVPGPMIRLLLGELGEVALLGGAKVLPKRLERAGFRFCHPDLETALRFELGRFKESFSGPEFGGGE